MKNPKNIKLINSLLAIFVGLSVLVFVLAKIAFPEFKYFLNKADQYKIQIQKVTFDEQNYLAIAPLNDYNYNKIELKVSRGDSLSGAKLPVFKNYMVNLYPKGQSIETVEKLLEYLYSDGEIINGQLFAYKNAVFIYSRGKFHPFLGPEVFEKLGYDWDKVSELSKDKVTSFLEGDKITFASVHPDGTLVKQGKDDYFLVWEQQLLPVKKGLLTFVEPEVGVVDLGDGTFDQLTSCIFNSSEDKNFSVCEFEKKESLSGEGPTYFIKLPQSSWQAIRDAEITFETLGSRDRFIARDSLAQIKKRLIEKYINEFKL